MVLHHGIAACGIETSFCTWMILFIHLHHGIAACGIETLSFKALRSLLLLACIMALPLAALKLKVIIIHVSASLDLHHGIAACGIET